MSKRTICVRSATGRPQPRSIRPLDRSDIPTHDAAIAGVPFSTRAVVARAVGQREAYRTVYL
jgi:hypothetical protein